MDGAEEAIYLFGIIVAFQRNQAIADHLQVLFGFRLKEFENLVGNFIIGRQSIEVGAGGGFFLGFGGMLLDSLLGNALLAIVERRSLSGKREAVTLFERGDIFAVFLAGVADFQQVGFEDGDSVGEEF